MSEPRHRNDATAQAAAQALLALVSQSDGASAKARSTMGDSPVGERVRDDADPRRSTSGDASSRANVRRDHFSNLPRLMSNDDGEARMPANRVRPPAMGKRIAPVVESKAPSPVIVLLNGHGAVAEQPETDAPPAPHTTVTSAAAATTEPAKTGPTKTEPATNEPWSTEADATTIGFLPDADAVAEGSTATRGLFADDDVIAASEPDAAVIVQAEPQTPIAVEQVSAPIAESAPPFETSSETPAIAPSHIVDDVEQPEDRTPVVGSAVDVSEPPGSADVKPGESPIVEPAIGEPAIGERSIAEQDVTVEELPPPPPPIVDVAGVVDAVVVDRGLPIEPQQELRLAIPRDDRPDVRDLIAEVGPDAPAFESSLSGSSNPTQVVSVRAITPDDAPPAIDVQRPLAPSRRGGVVPIFADVTSGTRPYAAPAPPSLADDQAARNRLTIARLAEISGSAIVSASDAAALPAPQNEITIDDFAASRPVEPSDDITMIPAPAPDVFARRLAGTSGGRSATAQAQRSLQLRRTIIPILLTLGCVSIALGGAWFALPAESGFRDDGPALPLSLLIAGPFILLLATLNMLQVRAVLAANPGSRQTVRGTSSGSTSIHIR